MRIFIALAALAAAIPIPAEAATRTFGVSGFDQIRIEGPFKVSVSTGIPPFARASGSAPALDAVAITVEGRTLVIRGNRSSWGGYPGDAKGPVEVAIGTHDLGTVWVNGAGSVAINRAKGQSFNLSLQGSGSASIASATVDHLKVALSGSASARIGGTAQRMTAIARGVSTLDATGLTAKDATIGADGSVTIDAVVTGTAKVDAQGTAAVTLAGRPSCVVKALGSSSVNGCK